MFGFHELGLLKSHLSCVIVNVFLSIVILYYLVAELSLKAKTNPSGSELGLLGLDSLKANTNPSGFELKADIGPDDDWVLDDSLNAKTKPSGLELNTDIPALLLQCDWSIYVVM